VKIQLSQIKIQNDEDPKHKLYDIHLKRKTWNQKCIGNKLQIFECDPSHSSQK